MLCVFRAGSQVGRIEEKIHGNSDEIYLAICLKCTDAMIGYISISDIGYRHGRAHWSGIVIGGRDCRGRGCASNAAYLMLEYVFDKLGLQRLSGAWLEDNQ